MSFQVLSIRRMRDLKQHYYTVVGRITSSDLSACLTWLRVDRTHVYLCGPSSMLTDMDTALVSLGLDEGHIKYEMWWWPWTGQCERLIVARIPDTFCNNSVDLLQRRSPKNSKLKEQCWLNNRILISLYLTPMGDTVMLFLPCCCLSI